MRGMENILQNFKKYGLVLLGCIFGVLVYQGVRVLIQLLFS